MVQKTKQKNPKTKQTGKLLCIPKKKQQHKTPTFNRQINDMVQWRHFCHTSYLAKKEAAAEVVVLGAFEAAAGGWEGELVNDAEFVCKGECVL